MPPKKPLRPGIPLKPTKPVKPVKPVKPLKPAVPLKPATALDKETAKILQLKEEIGQSFWELGQCLNRVNDQQLFKQAGFESFDRYLGRRGVNINRRKAYRVMDVARNFSRFIARKHGQTKLLAAIELAKATPEEDKPVDVLAYKIEVRESGKTLEKNFAKASSREIKLAASRIKRLHSPTPKPLKPAWQNAATRAIRKVDPKAKLQVQMGVGRDPEVKLSISGVRASEIRAALAGIVAAMPEG